MHAPLTALIAALVCAGSTHGLVITVPGDFDTIQEAIDAAANGDDIQVGPGTWTADGESIIDFQGKNLRIYSLEGPATTILDGQSASGRRCRAALCDGGLGSTVTLQGFTIVNCRAPHYDWNGNGQEDFWEYFGGAIWCRGGSSPTIFDCRFVNCTSEYGGAICNWDEAGNANNPRIELCTFENNSAGFGVGGAIYSNASTPWINRCTFIGNTAQSGGAIMNYEAGFSVVTRSDFIDNRADRGGAVFNDSSMPGFGECTFIDNTAVDHGGAVFNADPSSNQNVPVFSRCLFEGNEAGDEGGAMHNFSCSPGIAATSFENNRAAEGGAIFSWNQSLPEIFNTTFCGNTPEDIAGTWNDGNGNTFDPSCGDGPAGDLTGDAVVDGQDLAILLADWNCTGTDCIADLDGDALVDGQDLAQLLADWS
ncbi:MAG: hypothetical protein VX641_04410 [Planctomycetota bacterium]|nr:hypothetical protein [Planctomycetota bacterium]